MTAWYERAKPGDKIVCIIDEYGENWLPCLLAGCSFHEKGRIYTIRQIAFSKFKQHWALRLVEIVNPEMHLPPYRPGELTFGVRRFRPVVSRPSEISIFTDMLTKVGEPVDA